MRSRHRSNWEPNPTVIQPGRFLRVRLTDNIDCVPYGEPDLADERESNVDVAYKHACDFKTSSIRKFARTSLKRTDVPAYRFATDFSLSFAQVSASAACGSVRTICV